MTETFSESQLQISHILAQLGVGKRLSTDPKDNQFQNSTPNWKNSNG